MKRRLLSAVSLLGILAGAAAGRAAFAQAPVGIPAQVRAVFDGSIYLGKGSADGVQQGDIVKIYDQSGRSISAQIQSVASHDARCTLIDTRQRAVVGQQAVILIPSNAPVQPATDGAHPSARSESTVAPVQFRQQAGPGAIIHVPVHVTAIAGGSFYIDKGRSSGILPGDEVVLFPPGSGIVNAIVQTVSKSSSRCTLPTGATRINNNTRGEVLVPSQRLDRQQPTPSPLPGKSPEHPPWSSAIDGWDDSRPLLAPIHAGPREQRESEWYGRIFAQYLHTWNRNVARNQYSLGRVGMAVWRENPFRRNGSFHLNGELNRRGIFLSNEADQIQSPGWINRLSYRWGEAEDEPWQVEVGRFLPNDFPEFGLLDGAAVTYRMNARNRVSVSAGLLPNPYPNLVTRDDFQIGVFYRWIADEEETLSSGIGFQKTWHKGTPDRDLLIHSFDYYPNDRFSVHSTVWCDLYDSHDRLEPAPVEITQAVVQPMYRPDPSRGIGVHLSYVRWPQLLRMEYGPFVNRDIIRGRVFRYGIFAWQQLGTHVRLDGRVDQWDDERADPGASWEGGISVRDWFYDRGEVSLAFFGTEGLYSTGPGGRLRLSRQFDWCYGSLSYELADYQFGDQSTAFQLGSTVSGITQQYLRANFDFSLDHGKSISVFGDYRLGQYQNAFQAGVFFQKRL